MLPPCKFSEKVEKMRRRLKPYFAPEGGIRKDAPPEIKNLFEKYKEQVKEEMWLD